MVEEITFQVILFSHKTPAVSALQHWLLVFCEKKVLAMNTQQEPTLIHFKYFLDIYDTLEQSKERSRRGFWLDDRCLKMTIGSFTFAGEVLRTSSSAKEPELSWILFQPFVNESRNGDK